MSRSIIIEGFNEDSLPLSQPEVRATRDDATVGAQLPQQPIPDRAQREEPLTKGYRDALKIAAGEDDIAKAKQLLADWVSDPYLPELEVFDFHWSMAAAIDHSNRELIKLFLEYGARPESSLHTYLVRYSGQDVQNFEGILQDLFDTGWDITDSHILRDAAAAGNEVLFRWLLHHGASPNKGAEISSSPMSCIARGGTLSSLKLLFDHGASVDNNSMSAAARRGEHDVERITIMQLLIAHGGDVNAPEDGVRYPTSSALRAARLPRFTALYLAARADDVEMVELLLENGADPWLRIRFGEQERGTPWGVMCASGDERMQALVANMKLGLLDL